MVDGKCSTYFPKTFQEKISMNDNRYLTYRRRNTGKTYEKPRGYTVDNRHVVPK